MDVHVTLLVKFIIDAQHVGAASNDRHRGLNRLLHDVAELARMYELALSGHDGGFDGEQLTTHFRPRQSGDLTDLIVVFGTAIAKALHTEVFPQVPVRNPYDAGARAQQQFLHDLSTDLGQFALQIPHPASRV